MTFARLLRDVWVGGCRGKWLQAGQVVCVACGPDALGDLGVVVPAIDQPCYLAAGDYEACNASGAAQAKIEWHEAGQYYENTGV